MAWATLAKVGLGVALPLLLEFGDDIADGVGQLFDKKPNKDTPWPAGNLPIRKPRPSIDQQEAGRELMRSSGARGLPKMSAEQAASIAAIAQVCNVLEIFEPDERRAIALALVVNAWHESRLRPGARNTKGEDSRGLFQINTRAHPQWARFDLYDPRKNIAAILILALKQRQFLDAVASGSFSQLVYVICRFVERPRNPHESALRRVATAREWFGAAAD